MRYKAAAIPKGAFIFCRYGVAVMLWLSYFMRAEWLLLAALAAFVLSAAFTITKAPMILLYKLTIEKLVRTRVEFVNVQAMQFAHILAAMLTLSCVLLMHLAGAEAGWRAVLILAALKSISALGFCPASKLYECATGDSCCTFLGKKDG